MEPLLLAVHVIAAIVFIGPATVGASLFPRYVPLGESRIAAARATDGDSLRSLRVAEALHRLTRVYALLAVAVPVAGLALALVQGRLGEIWISIAMALTAVAAGILWLRIVPAQAAALAAPPPRAGVRSLSALAGVFNLLWVAVVVLMIVRPGSDYVA